ncbi:MAG TPA: thrombospondin type 3 repeat-containing protein, partial [Polyangiaceae bacterium]
MNAGSVDDLVAQRASGEVDVFLGGASGLTFTASIDPIPLRLDRDTLSDFAWLDGDSGINTASSIFGQSFRDVVPDTIELTDVKAGVFQSRAGEDAGIADLVTVGVDAAGGGVVIWCESNGNGVICSPALDARFATGRDPTGVEVRDLNADGLDDITVSYADDPTRIILAKPDGFTPLAPAKSFRTGVPFTSPIDLEPEDGQDFETGFIAFDDNAGFVDFTLVDGNGLELGPFLTPFAFAEPFALALGNFNDDGIASALEEGSIPLLDFVVRSGNTLFVMIAGGDGAFSFTEIEAPADMVDFRAADVTGDGVDDLEVIRADGSLSVFPGLPGTAAGIDTGGLNFTGLPTPDGNDGEMLLLSGLGVDTVAATEARFRISVGPGDTAALAQLAVQVFDGDNGGLHQFDEETNVLKTCYRLSADPCGDGNAGSCAGGPIAPTEIVTVSSDVLGDDRWDTIFEGAHSPDASIAGNGLPPFNYELRVFLSQDCAVLPAPGSTIAVATADAFKVRSNGLLSMPAGEFSLVGSDSSGAFGVEQLPYLRDTNYDGTFDIPLAVGSSATEIQLKEADADEIGDATPGVSLGANAEIQYRLLTPNGTSAPLVGAENATATTLVTNPSGNNDGIAALDVETRIHTIGAPTPGTWTWQWEGVKAVNAFHVFTPFGSPTTHEVLGARRLRTKLTTAEQPYYWEERSALEAALPVVLGKRYADGRLEGTSLEVGDASTALEILGNSDETPEGELRRQLLVAKLNGARGALLGENITGALVYGTTRTVRETLRAADAAVAGVDLLRDQAKTERLVQLLSSVNLGELTYQQPGVPFPEEPMADLDEDGVVDLKDNCPTVANPAQEDEDDNRIGDACNVLPSVSCVLARSPGEYTAYFGYENPLSQRTIAAGTRNGVTSSAGEREFEQPSEFWGGLEAQAFRADFSGSEQLTWALEGELAVADRDSLA